MSGRGWMAAVLLVTGVARASEWEGEYKFSQSPAEIAARKKAIEYSTETLFFVIRGAIISRLEGKSVIHQKLYVSLPAGKVVIDAEHKTVVETPDSGPAVPVKIDGETFSVAQHLEGKVLSQSFTSSEGNRTNAFTLEQGGKVLREKVTVTSSKLSHPVVYDLTYNRQ